MFSTMQRFHFSAGHRLDKSNHPCARIHGHSYTLELEVWAEELDGAGLVVDPADLEPFRQWLRTTVDGRHLNHIVDFCPSAPLVAAWLHECATSMLMLAPDHTRLRLWQGPDTMAEYWVAPTTEVATR